MNTVELIEEYYTKNYNKLVKAWSRAVGGDINAEDVVQEAFTRALSYKDSYNESIAPVQVWFIGILRNAARDFMRAERNSGGVASSPLEKGSVVEFEEHMSELIEMSQTDGDTVERILLEITEMGNPEKQVLWLYFFRNYSMSEIYNIVDGVTYNRCEYLVWAFKQKMSRKYKDEDKCI